MLAEEVVISSVRLYAKSLPASERRGRGRESPRNTCVGCPRPISGAISPARPILRAGGNPIKDCEEGLLPSCPSRASALWAGRRTCQEGSVLEHLTDCCLEVWDTLWDTGAEHFRIAQDLARGVQWACVCVWVLCVCVPCSRLDMEAPSSGSLASMGLPDSAHPNKLWSFSLSWGPAIPAGNPQSHLSAYEIPTSPCIYLTEGCTSEGTPAGISLYWSICHGEGKRATYTLLGKQRWNTLQRLVFQGNFHLAAPSNSSC